jgi:Glycosyl transferases group 1/Glycosyltransferase Family 4
MNRSYERSAPEERLAKADRLTLVAYSRFGARGLKGIEMYYLVKELWKKNRLQKVIAVSKKDCRYVFDLGLIETLPGQSRLVSALGQIKKKVWKAFPSSWLSEMIFDQYAAYRLTEPGDILLTTSGLVRTAQRAKALGYTTFLYGATPDPRYLAEEVRTEQTAFGLAASGEDTNRARQMARFAAHVAVSDYIIAVSDFAKETYVQYGFPAERIFVAPLGVDLQRFRTSPVPLHSPYFTYLLMAHVSGTTGILKGLPYLLQAWSELDLKKAKLQVCGEMGPEAKKLIREYAGKVNNVEFTGYVSNPEEYYRNSSVFVLPSLAEGLPRAVLEAMACGRPVITTPILKPVVRDGIDGVYVPMRDVQALKQKMLYFYERRQEAARMGANASARARLFTWQRFSRQAAEILSSGLQSRPSDSSRDLGAAVIQ